MSQFFIGVGQVTVNLRHSQSTKDKRRYLSSVQQKLKNLGFSVTQCGYLDHPKRGVVGFVIAGSEHGTVDRQMNEGVRVFYGESEVLDTQTDVFDYSEATEERLFSFFDRDENDG